MRFVIVTAFVACFTVQVHAQTAPALPSGRDLIQRALHVTGADTVLPKHRTFRTLSTVKSEAYEGTRTWDECRSNAGSTYMMLSGEDGLALEQGYADSTAWQINSAKPKILTGSAVHWPLRRAVWIDGPAEYRTMTNEGIVRFGDVDAYKVALVMNSGMKLSMYIDPATGLPLGLSELDNGKLAAAYYSNYKNVGGMLFPMKQMHKSEAFDQEMVVETAEFDTCPAATFALPLVVKNLKKGK